MTTPDPRQALMAARRLGHRDGVRWAVTWLHREAGTMNDPHATGILNAAASQMGMHYGHAALAEAAPADDLLTVCAAPHCDCAGSECPRMAAAPAGQAPHPHSDAMRARIASLFEAKRKAEMTANAEDVSAFAAITDKICADFETLSRERETLAGMVQRQANTIADRDATIAELWSLLGRLRYSRPVGTKDPIWDEVTAASKDAAGKEGGK